MNWGCLCGREEALDKEFPFTIRDISYILNLHIRHRSAISWDADCPFCSGKGKLNLNLKKNVFRCNRCGEYGGMLALYGKIYGVDNKTAKDEIEDILGRKVPAPAYEEKKKLMEKEEPEIVNAQLASVEERNKTYSMLLSMLVLADTHKDNLLDRGLSEEQIEKNGYKSTPIFGFKRLTQRLLDAGCIVEGVPGFYQDQDGQWTVHFSKKTAGYLVPYRDEDGRIQGMQIRLNQPFDGCKYIWVSSVNFHMGVSSGSPVHLAGELGATILYITEGGLKGDVAHALSGETFGCIAGVNQYANLPSFLKLMKQHGTKYVYEAYDMDKLLDPICCGDYNEKCSQCEYYRGHMMKNDVICEKKGRKKQNVQNGCEKLVAFCRSMNLPVKMLTWDMDVRNNWKGKIKGIDDYLFDLAQRRDDRR